MATNITPVDKDVQATTTKTFVSAKIVKIKHFNGGDTSVSAVIVSDDEENPVESPRGTEVSGMLSGKTVQQALDDLESFLGEAPDLTTLSVEDFLHSVAHQHMRDNDLYT